MEKEVGDKVILTKKICSFPEGYTLKLLEINEKENQYRIGISENFGSIWLKEDCFK
jgi:hypothetical protein